MFNGQCRKIDCATSFIVGDSNSLSNLVAGATSFNQDLNSWTTSTVQDASSMFAVSVAEESSLLLWFPVLKVPSSRLSHYFLHDSFPQGATSFHSDITGWNTALIRNFANMFDGKGERQSFQFQWTAQSCFRAMIS